MANVNQIVYLTKAQYAELVRNGSITVNGITVTYDQNNIYITPQEEPITDLQVGGTSVPVLDGVANVPLVSGNNAGAIIVGNGLAASSSGILSVQGANRNDASLKAGNVNNRSITPYNQDISVFYGLAKASGDTTQASSSNAVGEYTEEAKKAIRKMLGIPNFEAELIADVTTTEDLEFLDIETDTIDYPFSLRSMKVCALLPQSTTGTKDFITANVIHTDSAGTKRYSTFPTLSYNSASSESLFVYELESAINSNLFFMRGYVASGYNRSSNTVISFTQTTPIYEITGFRIRQYNSTSSLIPAGTNIKIFGIRN